MGLATSGAPASVAAISRRKKIAKTATSDRNPATTIRPQWTCRIALMRFPQKLNVLEQYEERIARVPTFFGNDKHPIKPHLSDEVSVAGVEQFVNLAWRAKLRLV